MKFLLGIFIIFFGIVFTLPLIFSKIFFSIDCGGRMERAANANTIELAIVEMEVVVKYLEHRNLTSGYTSVFYRTPDEDLGYFYNNMKSSLNELKSIKPDASSLEKSNVLMKLRETLLSDTEEGASLDVPDGISRYPYNFLFGLFFLLGVVVAILGLAVCSVW